MVNKKNNWKVFICHAKVDNDNFAEPLANALNKIGQGVWFDKFSISHSEDLEDKIHHGLNEAKGGIVIISESFIKIIKENPDKRHWTVEELSILNNKKVLGNGFIIPIFYKTKIIDLPKQIDYIGRIKGIEFKEGDSLSELAQGISDSIQKVRLKNNNKLPLIDQKWKWFIGSIIITCIVVLVSLHPWHKEAISSKRIDQKPDTSIVLSNSDKELSQIKNSKNISHGAVAPTNTHMKEIGNLNSYSPKYKEPSNRMVSTDSLQKALKCVKRGDNYSNEFKYKYAIIEYDSAMKLDPYNEKTYNSIVLIKFKLGDYIGAIEDMNQAIKIMPNNSMYYYKRGALKIEIKDYRGSIADLNKAMQIDPNNKVIYCGLGDVNDSLSHYSEAIEDYNKVIKIDPHYIDAYVKRAKLKVKLNDNNGAILDYTQAILIDSTYAVAYYERGLLVGNVEEDPGKMIKDIQKSCDLRYGLACDALKAFRDYGLIR